jgi:Cdc6-like AAA superfamily ATPase
VNPQAFSLDFVPENLLVRDGKVGEILSEPYPKFIFGKKDTGKTVTARWIAQHGLATYVHCGVSLKESLKPLLGRGYSNRNAVDKFLQTNPKQPVIFDEVHRFAKYRLEDLNYTLLMLRDDYPSLKAIFITNVEGGIFLSRWLRPDVADRYSTKHVVFEDYNREQVEKIFQQRFELAGIECDKYLLQYLSAVYNAGTPLREILNALHSLAVNRMKISIESVENYFRTGIKKDLQLVFESLEVQKALLLGSIAKAQQIEGSRYGKFGSAEPPAAGFQDVCMIYNTIMKHLPNGRQLSGKTLHRYLDQLEEYYVKTEIRNYVGGRGVTTYCACLMDYNALAGAFTAWFTRRFGYDPFEEVEAGRQVDG